MLESDYEALKKLGYTEEEIKVSLEGLSGLDVFSSPLGENREDKGVRVSPSGGNEKRTSNIMMGYNKDGITLNNGEYVELSEFVTALEENLKEDKENVKIVLKKTGKEVDRVDAIDGIVRDAISGSTIGLESNFLFDNQNSMSVQINDVSGKIYEKGSFMLGQIEMPNGEYVHVDDIKTALEQYIIMQPGEEIPPLIEQPTGKEIEEAEIEIIATPEIPKEPQKETKKEEKYRIIKRIRKKMSMIPIFVGLGAYLISGLSLEAQEQVTIESYNDLDYAVQEMIETTHHIYESDEEVLERIRSDIKVGQEASVQEGTRYYASSDHEYGGNNLYGTFGSVIRPEGEYTVDRISVLHEGKIINVDAQPGKDVASILQETANSLGVEVNDLEAKASLVGPVSGWVSIDELNLEADLTPQVKDVEVTMSEGDLLSGTLNKFEGDTIEVDGTTLKIKDESGNLLEDGTIIKSSDGREFRVSSLDEEEQSLEHIEENGKKLTWSLQDCDKELLLIGALSAFMRKNKKEFVNLTDTQLDAIIQRKKEEFEETSDFTKAVETLTTKQVELGMLADDLAKQSLIEQETTLEQFEEMKGMRR